MKCSWRPPRPDPHYIDREIKAQRWETVFSRALAGRFPINHLSPSFPFLPVVSGSSDWPRFPYPDTTFEVYRPLLLYSPAAAATSTPSFPKDPYWDQLHLFGSSGEGGQTLEWFKGVCVRLHVCLFQQKQSSVHSVITHLLAGNGETPMLVLAVLPSTQCLNFLTRGEPRPPAVEAVLTAGLLEKSLLVFRGWCRGSKELGCPCRMLWKSFTALPGNLLGRSGGWAEAASRRVPPPSDQSPRTIWPVNSRSLKTWLKKSAMQRTLKKVALQVVFYIPVRVCLLV